MPELQMNINARLIRIHGFCPAQVMLDYTPQWMHGFMGRDDAASPEEIDDAMMQDVPAHEWALHIECRDETREAAATATAHAATQCAIDTHPNGHPPK